MTAQLTTSRRSRLPTGGRIDRARTLTFRFDGKTYEGCAGDTLASALLASGVRIAGRSFKLHRPRGFLGQWSEEPNAIVQIGEGAELLPNQKATQVELYEGLTVRSVNCWPSAQWDLFALTGLLYGVLPAGFYYKTFMWPSWGWFEPAIRRAAGLGVAPLLPDPDRYEERHESCDVLVVGGGVTGLSAALSATRAGARVVLVDDRPVLGGALQWEEHLIGDRSALEWIDSVRGELQSSPRTRILQRTTAFGCYDHGLVALCERSAPATQTLVRERLWHVRATQIVLATGAIERPMVFPNNDVPGVMLASAAQSYAVQYGVRVSDRAVIVTNSDSAYEAAEALQTRGISVVAIVDTRHETGEAGKRAERSGIPVLSGHAPVRVVGSRAVRALDVQPLAKGGERWQTHGQRHLSCDLVGVCGGWTPSVHLFSQAGGRLRYAADRAALVPAADLDSVRCAGAAAGSFALRDCLSEGFAAGEEAARRTGAVVQHSTPPAVISTRASVSPFWGSPRVSHAKAWVDLQNDVTRGDVELAVRENLRSVEHVKRYTTTGMALDQGKTSNMNALGILADLTQRGIAELGTTTFRPPYDPVTLGTLVARHRGAFYHPLRRTPLDSWHRGHHAVLEDFGGWARPAWYARGSESRDECIRHEKRAARAGVSLFDGSPLGKLEVRGPDAAVFLNRMYYQAMHTLGVGQVRYGIMLNEHGTIIDDGVCLRLAADHYLVSTTSGGANRIFGLFEDNLQCEWPDLRVFVTNATSAWGTIAVAGPRARDLIARLATDVDLTRGAFPHLSVRSGKLEGVPVRMARVGFSGELSFEISVPAGYTASLWDALLEVGAELEVRPIGLDALMELRTEKGYLHVGTDTDGRTLPADIGMEGVLARKTEDFIGRRSLERSDAKRADRLQFVGLASEDPGFVLPVGAHVIGDPQARSGTQGYVTSSCASEALGRSVALGLVAAGRRRIGETVHVFSAGQVWPARLVAPGAYDPKGERLRA